MQKILFSLLFISSVGMTNAQDFGLSFSYFIPKNGYFSTPISPFSVRGIGFGVGDHLGIQTGVSLYRMAGMNVTGLPFESKKPIAGPAVTLLMPLEVVVKIGNNNQEFSIKGGGFAFYSFDQKLNNGNLDRAIRRYEGWDVANGDFSIDRKLGLGYQFGVEYMVYVTRQIGLSLEVNYYIGGADLGLRGSYIGGVAGNGLTRKNRHYEKSQVDFTGLEISIGFVYSAKRK